MMKPAGTRRIIRSQVRNADLATGRKKDKHIPAALQEQWEKDRQKKAENKRKRREDILAAAADPLTMHKGGKKGRKAMLAAARLESHTEVENRIVDFASLEAQIRRFLFDIGGKDTMALPPCDKATRKRIHELAEAFSLKSQSKGKGAGRYTTLVKTSRSGLGINEKKVSRILKTSKGNTWDAPDGGKGKDKGRVQSLAKHREGEEVGKVSAVAALPPAYLTRLCIAGCTQDWRIEYRIPHACKHGLGRRRQDRFVGWFGCAIGCKDEENEAWSRCDHVDS